jgi:hypothetical protein
MPWLTSCQGRQRHDRRTMCGTLYDSVMLDPAREIRLERRIHSELNLAATWRQYVLYERSQEGDKQ